MQKKQSELSDFIRNTLKDVVDMHLLGSIRALWPHKLIVKGVLNEQDAELAKQAGVDAIIVSNHGGRQLDITLPAVLSPASISPDSSHKGRIWYL